MSRPDWLLRSEEQELIDSLMEYLIVLEKLDNQMVLLDFIEDSK